MADWVKGFYPSVLTDRMERSRAPAEGGGTGFSGLTLLEHVSVLTSMLKLSPEIPENEAHRIIVSASFDVAKAGGINPESLLSTVSQLEKSYLRKPKKSYRLVTSISATFERPFVFRNADQWVSFGRKLPKRLSESHLKKVANSRGSIFGDLPSAYSPVQAFVIARSADEAANHALDNIDFFRAVFNLWKNRRHNIRLSSGPPSPVNALILGPIHTLHEPTGELATDEWWYEPSYVAPVVVWRDRQNFEKLESFVGQVRAGLRRSRYEDVLKSCLLRYVRSLDSRDWNSCFLQLWSAIEALTGTGLSDSHKVTVKRASFIFQNAEYALEVLNHLRNYRNSAVHGGKQSQRLEPVIYQAKNFVEALLEFHIAMAGEFDSMSEFAEFADSPRSLDQVSAQISRLKKVGKFVSSEDK